MFTENFLTYYLVIGLALVSMAFFVWKRFLLPSRLTGHKAQSLQVLRVTSTQQNYHSVDNEITFLPNRDFICKLIKQLIAEKRSSTDGFAVVALELTNFSEVSSLVGYINADNLISEVASRMSGALGHEAKIIRLSVNYFAVVLTKINSKNQLIEALESLTAVFSSPIDIETRQIFITVRVGASLFPEHSLIADELLHFSDISMLEVSNTDQVRYQVYQPVFTSESFHKSELDLALRLAVKSEQLEMFFQPIIALNSRKIVCAEALLRWKHPTFGMIPPNKFIPLAEESGLILEIGNWVLKSVFQTVYQWNSNSNDPIKVAINLSPRQFSENDFVSTITRLLAETNCKADWIKLEITESLLLNKSDSILITLMQLSDMGFELSIDDFGTGYSALSYLTRYPISQIKIDRSFIMDIPIDLEKCELVKIIIHIAKILHLELVAEGVESQEQVDFLVTNGCQFVQGYFFGKPMPVSALTDLLAIDQVKFSNVDTAADQVKNDYAR